MKETYKILSAQTFLSAPEHAIGFIGTADPWSDTKEIIKDVMKKTLDFCAENS